MAGLTAAEVHHGGGGAIDGLHKAVDGVGEVGDVLPVGDAAVDDAVLPGDALVQQRPGVPALGVLGVQLGGLPQTVHDGAVPVLPEVGALMAAAASKGRPGMRVLDK